MKDLEKLTDALTDAEPAAIATLLAATSDVALVVGEGNVIRSVPHPGSLSTQVDMGHWPGRPFDEVVTADTREIAERLLNAARGTGAPDPRAIAHGGEDGARIELRYTAASLGPDRPIVLVGRTLRGAPGSVEADPYSPLFEYGRHPALVVDGRTGAILEAGVAAAEGLGTTVRHLRGGDFFELLSSPWRREARSRLRGVMASGRSDRFIAEAGRAETRFTVTVDRQASTGDAATLLVRLLPAEARTDVAPPASDLVELMGSIPECVTLLDEDGRVRWANEAFFAAAGLAGMGDISDRRLDELVMRAGNGDLSALLSAARSSNQPQRAEVSFAGQADGRAGEMTIAWLPNASPRGFSAVISLPSAADRARATAAPDVAALLEMVGNVPLKDMVRDTTDVVERLCIEAALRLTGDNRAAAARALGLSRQSLYLKLERYGLG
jgi:transcriptional regulator PpsR